MTLRVYILARNLFATKGKISKTKPNLTLTNQYHGENGGGYWVVVVMMMMVMMMTLFSSGCLPHPKITNYTRAAATAFPGEPFETGETETKRYFLFDQQMVRIFSL